MENLEVILMEMKKSDLDELIFKELCIVNSCVKSSHFFDNDKGKDLEFHEIKSMLDIFRPNGTGNIVVECLNIGIPVKNVVIIISFDEVHGDVVINFPENEILGGNVSSKKVNLNKLISYLIYLKTKFLLPQVQFGYEPAYDEDTCLVEIKGDNISIETLINQMNFK